MLGMIAGNAFSRRVARHRLRGPDQLTKTFKLRVTRRLLRRANGRRFVGLRFVAVRLVALRLVVVRLVAFRLVAPRFVTLRFVALRVVALRFVGLRLDALRFVAVRLVVLRLGIGLELLEGGCKGSHLHWSPQDAVLEIWCSCQIVNHGRRFGSEARICFVRETTVAKLRLDRRETRHAQTLRPAGPLRGGRTILQLIVAVNRNV